MAKRPKVGDVIEISIGTGHGYAQFSHWNEDCGALLRVFPGVHRESPNDFREFDSIRQAQLR